MNTFSVILTIKFVFFLSIIIIIYFYPNLFIYILFYNNNNNKYQQLRHEIASLWGLKKVDVIPVVIGALGDVSMKLEKWMKKMEIEVKVELLQKTALLGTARIIRKVLNS